MWPGIAISASVARCGNSSPNSAGSPAPPFSARCSNEVGCSHQSLAQFFGIDQVNRNGIAKLLAAMKSHSKPVAPKHLGVIGVEHLKQRFLAAGGNSETFKYQCRKGMTPDGIPYVVEFAFGLHQSGLSKDGVGVPRKFITGANWSVGISNPFRAFGSTGEGLESTLAKVRANATAAGDLRAASGVGVHPIRRPRQKLDHPHRQRGAAR